MEWYRSKRGWITATLGAAYFILDHWGRVDSAREIYHFLRGHLPPWSSVSPLIAPLLFLSALVFFEVDRRKAKRSTPYDLNTLKGRTLELRDEMQQFLDATPSSDEGSGTVRIDYLERSSGSSLRVVKLRFGYFSRFSAHVNQILNEFGERNLRDVRLEDALGPNRQVYDENFYRLVIDRLSRLAESPEAESEESRTSIGKF
jgi:hypothetical protein